MLVEAFGSAVLGLALSWVAVRRLPGRLPSARVVLTTGALGALFGAYLTHYALGPGHRTLTASLVGAVLVAAAGLSLLLRTRTPFPVASRG
ncbi:hypothetical protein ACIQUQ_00155 [Streptomyces sp. NPDC101118]|uniref:hypothetical protein n=1 Tax=unclassified Streptomyces TaxID=2593676 RepID=UPI0037D54C2E